MASSSRTSQSSWRHYSGIDDRTSFDPNQLALDVTPITCVPYTGPSSPNINAASSSAMDNPASLTTNHPTIVFIPSHPTDEEWNNILAATKKGIALSGSAALGKVGPTIGSMDIVESEDEYVFRVSLPGVKRDESSFSCDAEASGKILIKGITTTGEKTVTRNNMVFEMRTQNMCPAGEFSIAFQLPGPIDHQRFDAIFGADGIFEGVVKKQLL